MTFGELRKKRIYIIAATISFVNTDGEEIVIDNLDDEILQDTRVAGTYYNGSHLEIMLH